MKAMLQPIVCSKGWEAIYSAPHTVTCWVCPADCRQSQPVVNGVSRVPTQGISPLPTDCLLIFPLLCWLLPPLFKGACAPWQGDDPVSGAQGEPRGVEDAPDVGG